MANHEFNEKNSLSDITFLRDLDPSIRRPRIVAPEYIEYTLVL
jgi:hypothetical protein